ncbi:Dehydrogenase/reductase SDR family member 1 [Aphelenchoides besseyi]|nr:Dehydrogenase/reductase SDR family member 1 [Aphelenchoides besseyi]
MGDWSIFLEDYNYDRMAGWMGEQRSFVVKSIVAYLIAIFGIKLFLRDRKPFKLERILTAWNAALALFSLLGVWNMTPVLYRVIRDYGLAHTYTHISELETDKSAGYWHFLWVCSKIPEFIDTLFIVLRKRPLIVMHYWHHVSTAYTSFVCFSTGNAFLVWCAWINYAIHAVMYSYYSLRSMGFLVPPQIAQLITMAQIFQMFFWNFTYVHLVYLTITGYTSLAYNSYALFCAIITTNSLLLMWFQFYYRSYYQNGGQKYEKHKLSLQTKGQVALVTGASRGCGRGIALQLGTAGATVYITALREEEEDEVVKSVQHKLPTLESVAEEITKRGGKGIAVFCDHRSSEQVADLFTKISNEQDGRLDILVNNCFSAVTTMMGCMHNKFYELSETVYDICLDTGLRGHYITTRQAALLMIPRKNGLIVEIGSLGGVNYVFNVAYGMQKAATDRLAADVALELKEFRITSVALASGPVNTELFSTSLGLVQTKKKERVKDYYDAAESIEFQGKCLVAFASDEKRFERTGHILLTQELAKEYGIFEDDGRQPSCKVADKQLSIVEQLNRIRTKIQY